MALSSFVPRIATHLPPLLNSQSMPIVLKSAELTAASHQPVFLLDTMSFIFRAYHAMQRSRPMSTRSGLPTAATYRLREHDHQAAR